MFFPGRICDYQVCSGLFLRGEGMAWTLYAGASVLIRFVLYFLLTKRMLWGDNGCYRKRSMATRGGTGGLELIKQGVSFSISWGYGWGPCRLAVMCYYIFFIRFFVLFL